jgi:hypothetical protein
MLHTLSCGCGAVRGTVDTTRPHHRIICYCGDCQAYAHYLGHPEAVLDERGGSDVLQTVPSAMALARGVERLACVRMTPSGPLRWYADCCWTPIANTMPTAKVAFVGVLSSCLGGSGPGLDAAFGPAKLRGFVAGAKGDPKPKQTSLLAMLMPIVARNITEHLNGRHRQNPFFDTATGEPVAAPRAP